MDTSAERGPIGALITVMVVDDQPEMRSILRRMLRQEGIGNIIEAESGTAAYTMLCDPGIPDPDVIVSAMHMEGMDGMELVHQMRRDKNRTPVLILTGDRTELLHEVVTQVGADKVLLKPIAAPDLVREVHAAVGVAR